MAKPCVCVVLVYLENKMSVQEKSFAQLPKIHTTYANVIKSLLPSGDNKSHALPEVVYSVPKLVIDGENLASYREVCHFGDDGRVPATYFAVLSQTLQMNIMADKSFPFAMLGLVHLYNKVVQYRPVFDTEVVRLSVTLGNLQDHDKGQQFDFITQVFAGKALVWEGVSTYLSRQKNKKKQPKSATQPATIKKDARPIEFFASEDIGRRYAFISGDFNPIHLHPLSARAFGYPKAIAHGMWTKARTLAALTPLPDAFVCEVSFKSPLFLPAKATLFVSPTDKGWQLDLRGKNDKVHMTGHLSQIQTPS